MGVGGQGHAPAVLPLGKTRYALYRRLDRPQGRRKISPPPSFDPRPASCKSLYRLSYPGPLKWGEGKGKGVAQDVRLVSVLWRLMLFNSTSLQLAELHHCN